MRLPIFLLPSKPIHRLHQLPSEAGIYYVTAFWIIFYVGKSGNLRKRWQGKGHHRYQQFSLLSPFGRLHYRQMPDSEIHAFEKAEIRRRNLLWNHHEPPGIWQLLGLFLQVWLRVLVYSTLLLAIASLIIYLVWFAK